MDAAAVGMGIDPNLSFYLVSIANGCSAIGRFGSAVLSSVFGPLNVLLMCTVLGAVMTYTWPYARSAGSLIAIASIYGRVNFPQALDAIN